MRKLLLFLFSTLLCFAATAQSPDCSSATTICLDSGTFSYPASTNVPNAGSVDCLGSTPNPAWFWMQIDQSGAMDITISNTALLDIDFICWGPFESLSAACDSDLMNMTGVDCSYLMDPTEYCNIPNAQSGEIYVLLITNYSNSPTTIEYYQSNFGQDSAASIVCMIQLDSVSSNSPLCLSDTLFLMAPFIDSATYHWSGPQSFSSNDQNPVIPNIQLNQEGVYSVLVSKDIYSAYAHTFVDLVPLPTSDFTYDIDIYYPPGVHFYFNCYNNTSCLLDFGDGTFHSSCSNVFHHYSTGGTYNVKLIAYNDCGSDTITKTITVSGLGLDDLQNNKIEIYPNPADGKCFVDGIPLQDITRIECRSIDGKILFEGLPPGLKDGSNTVVDLSAFSPGIYLLKIQTLRNTYFAKIIRSTSGN
jgi:PKD repeat protein